MAAPLPAGRLPRMPRRPSRSVPARMAQRERLAPSRPTRPCLCDRRRVSALPACRLPGRSPPFRSVRPVTPRAAPFPAPPPRPGGLPRPSPRSCAATSTWMHRSARSEWVPRPKQL